MADHLWNLGLKSSSIWRLQEESTNIASVVSQVSSALVLSTLQEKFTPHVITIDVNAQVHCLLGNENTYKP